MEKLFVVCLSLAFLNCVFGQSNPLEGGKPSNPGAKLGLNRKLLDYINRQASQTFNDVVRNVTAPAFPVSVPNGEVFMSGLTVVNFVPPKYDYLLVKPNAFRWKLTRGQISLSTNMKHTIFAPKRSIVNGTMIMSSNNMEMTTLNAFGRNAQGQPFVYVLQCTARFDHFNLTFNGVNLFTLFQGIAPKVIIDYAQHWTETLFCSVMRSFMMNAVNSYLRTFPVRPLLGANFKPTKEQEMFLDYGLFQSPTTGLDLIDVALKGAVVSRLYGYTPFFPHDFADVRSKQMIDFYLSDFTVNSLAHIAHQLNLINFTASPKNLSSNNAARLQMQCQSAEICVGSLFPNATFPSGSTSTMHFKTTQAPKIVFNANGANWTAKGNVRFDLSSSTLAPSPKNVLLSANVPQISGTLVPKVTQNTISASISTTSITFEIRDVESSFGKFDSTKVAQLSNIVASIIEETLNPYLAAGLPVPLTSGVVLSSPQLQLLKRTLLVSSDLSYSNNGQDSFVDKVVNYEAPPFYP